MRGAAEKFGRAEPAPLLRQHGPRKGCREWVEAGKAHQTEQRTVSAHLLPYLNPTAPPQFMKDSNSNGVKESFTSLFPTILTVKNTNAS